MVSNALTKLMNRTYVLRPHFLLRIIGLSGRHAS